MANFHVLDLLVVAVYFAIVFYIGRRAAKKSSKNAEGFFLADRKLGKFYQFCLNFGTTADASGAVSTASLVYQQGVSGVWLSFQTIFMNPYYWFMNLWFRRVRLVTVADLFVDRMGSRRLANFYAIFQIVTGIVVTIGFGNLVAYKITASLMVKPETQWSVEERRSVEDYHEFKKLERASVVGGLTAAEQSRHDFLRERNSRGEINSTVTSLNEVAFYFTYVLAICAYVMFGGMASAALNEAFQSFLIVVFSFLLIPFGIRAIGGAGALAVKIPAASFELLGSGAAQVTGLTLVAILFVSIVQVHAVMSNMGVAGSARNEFAARFGAVAGTYAKRVMIILWAFCGLIAIALYQGTNSLSDPDIVWGTMSMQLLGPGLLGLMLAGVLAANMSSVSAQAVAISALFVRNIYPLFRPHSSAAHLLLVGRLSIIGVLLLGIGAALKMGSVFSALQLLLTVNVPFGAAVILIFLWRRLTAPAIWTAVVLSVLINVVVPLTAGQLSWVSNHPSLTVRTTDKLGALHPVYFETVTRVDPENPQSGLVGQGRFHAELWLLHGFGLDIVSLSPGMRFAARFFFDGILPFMLLFGVSLITRPPRREIVDLFYGKMKTPVAASPALDEEAMRATAADPARFDYLKLSPNSSFELTRWNRTDTIGFFCCCGISAGIIALFWFALKVASGHSI
jgi:SSS family solute:Na+ symporter